MAHTSDTFEQVALEFIRDHDRRQNEPQYKSICLNVEQFELYTELENIWDVLDGIDVNEFLEPARFLESELPTSPLLTQYDSSVGHRAIYSWPKLIVGSLISTALSLFFIFFFFKSSFLSTSEVVYGTLPGERKLVQLEDGSTAQLNGGTLIRVVINDSQRLVVLQKGEAFFSVKNDNNKTFVVQSGEVVTTVLGTRFNVSKQQDKVEVVVESGLVNVVSKQATSPEASKSQQNNAQTNLKAGDKAVVKKPGSLDVVHQIDVEKELAWRQGFIHFKQAPFSQVIEKMNYYYDGRLRLVDEKKQSILFSGTVKVDDLTAFLQAIEAITGARIEHDKAGLILIE